MRFIILACLLFSTVVNAQTIYVCDKAGKRIMSDQPCDKLGATINHIRTPESYAPLTTVVGLTPGQQQKSNEIKFRHDQNEAKWKAEREASRRATERADAENSVICNRLNTEKINIVSQLRQNSTQWLNDRHRQVNDEMYQRRCKTL